ncbi:MAG: Omp28-related outer membrane protein [Bacteroidota bacterium]
MRLCLWIVCLGSFLSMHGQVLVSEDFEALTLPTNWSLASRPGSTGWAFGRADDLSPASWKIPSRSGIAASNDDDCECDKSEDILWLPAIQPAVGASLFFQFDAYLDGFFGSVGKVIISKDGGNTYTEVFSVPTSGFWENYTLDLSDWVDGNTLLLGFLHDDSGNWATGFGVDNVSVRIPAEYDASISEIDWVDVTETGVQSVPIVIRNEGTQAINSLQVQFQMVGQPATSRTLTGLDMLPLETDTLLLTDIWSASPGPAQLRVEIVQINGNPDENSQDNESTRAVAVANQLAPSLILLEHFTQHNCEICATQNPVFEQVISTNESEVAVIAYHTFWPSPNNDPMHLANPQPQLDQIDYYDIVAVPRAFANGQLLQGGDFEGAPNGLTPTDIQRANRQKGLYQLLLTKNTVGNTLEVALDVTPLYILSGIEPYVKVALIEDILTFSSPPGDNGERIFNHVFRTFLNGSRGESIGSVGQNQTITRRYNIPLSPEWNGGQLQVVAWVQDDRDQRIWAAAKTQTITSNDPRVDTAERFFYAEGRVRIGNLRTGWAKLELRDMTGKTLWQQMVGSSEQIQLPRFPAGWYVMTLEGNGRPNYQKIWIP